MAITEYAHEAAEIAVEDPPRKTADGGKTRVQLDLSPVEMQRLNWIMEVCDFSTRKELFNNAIAILQWSVEESVKGHKVAAFNDETRDRYILTTPPLQAAAAHAAHVPVAERPALIERARAAFSSAAAATRRAAGHVAGG